MSMLAFRGGSEGRGGAEESFLLVVARRVPDHATIEND